MKCPHCEYEHGRVEKWDEQTCCYVDFWAGAEGDFYKLPVSMERKNDRSWEGSSVERTDLYACPRCMKTFVE